MRVTKVKIKKSGNNEAQMVLLQRTASEGMLVLENEKSVNKLAAILPEEKLESFKLSIKNKTVLKKRRHNGIADDVNKLIDALLYDKSLEQLFPNYDNITKKKIQACLTSKFTQTISFTDGNTRIEFDLADLILEYSKIKERKALEKYIQWVDFYIKTKSTFLKKSIENNKIPIDTNNVSKRKQALEKWIPEYSEGSKINLSELHCKYEIADLANSFLQVKNKYAQKTVPKNCYVFHQALKAALQAHQKNIFGTKENPHMDNRNDIQFSVYHLEVVKYLEHYFPLKNTGRKNDLTQIEYYLNEDTIKTAIQKQIENSIRNYLLQKGKVAHHQLNATVTSDTLTNIKRQESFVLNLIDICAFAANNIRTIVDKEQIKDILGCKDFSKSIEKDEIDTKLFALFYGSAKREPLNLWAMRASVQQIRNKIIHYEKEALNTIFAFTDFEFPNGSNINYTQTVFKDCLEKDIANITTLINEQLSSGGVFRFYETNDIENLLKKCTFSLCRATIPFTPGYKKVALHGSNYQYAKNEKSNLKLSYYLQKNDEGQNDEAYHARYFLQKMIYNNLFLPYFTDEKNKKEFCEAVKFVLDLNKKAAVGSKNPQAFAFKEIRPMKEDEKIVDFMAYVQSELMQEQNKKAEESDEQIRLNFEKFLLQVFVKGFDTYLQNNKVDFIKTPTLKEETQNNKKQIEITVTHAIQSNTDVHIAFYTLCKLLDASHLSNLRNEFIKFSATGKSDLQTQLQIIELCLLSADQIQNDWKRYYIDSNKYNEQMRQFVDGDVAAYEELFYQSDKITPVIHAPIELCRKYGTLPLLAKIAENYKITIDDYNIWKAQKEKIAEHINKRTKLHNEWVDKQKEFSNTKDYCACCEQIDTFTALDNKIHFVHLKNLHNLLIEVLGRMAGFVALRDRDFIFNTEKHRGDYKILKSINLKELLEDKKKRLKSTEPILKIIHKDIVRVDEKTITENERDQIIIYLKEVCKHLAQVFFQENTTVFEDRNYIAHFNFITTTACRSIVELINALRNLMSYDYKLKNAVTKSLIDVFDKHGMILKMEFDTKHTVQVTSVEPKKIYHLGTRGKEAITTLQVPVGVCEFV